MSLPSLPLRKARFGWWTLWLLSLTVARLAAQPASPVCRIDAQTQRADLDGCLRAYREPTTFIPLQKILRHPDRYPLRPVSPSFPAVEGRSYWLACPVRNESATPVPMLLEIRYPYLDAVEIYTLYRGRIRALLSPTGWQTPVDQRPFAHRNFVLPLTLPPGQTTPLYLHLRRESGEGSISVRLWSPTAFRQHDLNDTLFWGGVAGWLLFAGCFSLFLFSINRETLYLLYSLYVICHLLALVAYEGWFPYYFAQNAVEGKVWIRTSLYLVFVSNVAFIRYFFDSRQHVPRWLDALCLSSLAGWGVLTSYYLGLALAGRPLHPVWNHMYLFFVGLVSLYISLYIYFALQARRSRQTAQLYLTAFSPLLLIVAGYVALRLELLDDLFFVQIHGYATAVVFETVVLMAGLAFRFKSYRDERESLLLQQNQQQQQAHQLALDSQLQERQRLAKDLHDGIGTDLVVMKMRMETALYDPDHPLGAEESERLREYAAQLGQICQDVRAVSHNLMPTDLQLHGLLPAMQQLVERVATARPDLRIHFTHQMDELPPLHVQQPLYQMAKELLNNTVRHARASVVHIQLRRLPDSLQLLVADNGIGYDPADLHTTDGIGLRNVRANAELLHGHFTVETRKNGGVAHRISLPV